MYLVSESAIVCASAPESSGTKKTMRQGVLSWSTRLTLGKAHKWARHTSEQRKWARHTSEQGKWARHTSGQGTQVSNASGQGTQVSKASGQGAQVGKAHKWALARHYETRLCSK